MKLLDLVHLSLTIFFNRFFINNQRRGVTFLNQEISIPSLSVHTTCTRCTCFVSPELIALPIIVTSMKITIIDYKTQIRNRLDKKKGPSKQSLLKHLSYDYHSPSLIKLKWTSL